MTPKRKAALQWLHDLGEVEMAAVDAKVLDWQPSECMLDKMWNAGELMMGFDAEDIPVYTLSDLGRKNLHEG